MARLSTVSIDYHMKFSFYAQLMENA